MFEELGDHAVFFAAVRQAPSGRLTVLARARSRVDVCRSRSTLNGRFEDFGKDTNGDGFFDRLVLRVGLHATDPGHYLIVADLADRAGRTHSASGGLSVRTPGEHWIELEYAGEPIFDQGVDGPFTIPRIILWEHEPPRSATLQSGPSSYRTRVYFHREFQRDPARIARDAEARLVDRDADGQPDALDVGVLVDLDVVGEYTWGETLQDASGRGEARANRSAQLAPGEHRLVLRFRGSQLRPLGSEGTYRLSEFWVLGPMPAIHMGGIPVPGTFPSHIFAVTRGP